MARGLCGQIESDHLFQIPISISNSDFMYSNQSPENGSLNGYEQCVIPQMEPSSGQHTDTSALHEQQTSGAVFCDQTQNEPECITRWRIEFDNRLKVKDNAEREKIAQLEENGMKDLHNWGVQYRDTLSKSVKLSREHDAQLRTQQKAIANASAAVSGADAAQTSLWERVCDLCNFVPPTRDDTAATLAKTTSSKDSPKDMSRMRILLLQLKQNAPTLRRTG
ncbi:unnamed protein product [Dicrocoelium dendriticum]|nr:unnamed protein product [Dicrocoelium dendriticum]